MDSYTVLLISAFFFIMGAAIIGLAWYFQLIMKRKPGKSKNNTSTDPNLSEIARLLRNIQTQELVVRMEGKNYKAAHELTLTQHRRLSLASIVLAKWVNPTTLEPELMEVSPAELNAQPPEPLVVEYLSAPVDVLPAEPRSVYTPPFEANAPQEVKPISTKLPDVVGNLLNPTAKSEPEIMSIASQINDVLQNQLVGTPLESRGISVNEGHDRGVMVTLDGKQYEGVMDVPDEDVRRAIRAAVLEWETTK
jgi:hypothetical protein